MLSLEVFEMRFQTMDVDILAALRPLPPLLFTAPPLACELTAAPIYHALPLPPSEPVAAAVTTANNLRKLTLHEVTMDYTAFSDLLQFSTHFADITLSDLILEPFSFFSQEPLKCPSIQTISASIRQMIGYESH